MPLITCQNGQIHRLDRLGEAEEGFVTGLRELDELLPHGRLARGAVHEVLNEPQDGPGLFFALLLAGGGEQWAVGSGQGAVGSGQGAERHSSLPTADCRRPTRILVISDPQRLVYPPALAALGFGLSRLMLLRPKTGEDELWAVAEALRCRGVGAVIAAPGRLTKIQARRLQLAAERGGGVGILLRESRQWAVGSGQRGEVRGGSSPAGCRRPAAGCSTHAATTRWLVQPMRGKRTLQRWRIQLIHGHGGRLFHPLVLERCRETYSVRTVDPLVDRPHQETAGRMPA